MIRLVDLEQSKDGALSVSWPESSDTPPRGIDADTRTEIERLVANVRTAEDAGHPSAIVTHRLTLGRALVQLLETGKPGVIQHHRRQAAEAGESLRLVVRLLGPADNLASHPALGWRWELLADDDGHLVLAAPDSRVDVVTQLGSATPSVPKTLPTSQLRVLFMAFSPDGPTAVLDHEAEEDAILDVLSDELVAGRARLRVVEDGTLLGLAGLLDAGPADVVHLSGHGVLTPKGPRLVMEDELGEPHHVGPDELWRVLGDRTSPPRLVFLSCCHSADTTGGFPSLAGHLVAAGVETVVGWARPVRDDVATATAADLYAALCRGLSLPDAVALAWVRLRERDAAAEQRGELTLHPWATLQVLTRDGTGFRLDPRSDVPDVPIDEEARHGSLAGASRVRVLERGFVGRRRPTQQLVRLLRTGCDSDGRARAGAVVWGMKGVGKSCLAGRALQRHLDETGRALAVLHGRLDEASLMASFSEVARELGDASAEEWLHGGPGEVVERVATLLRERWTEPGVVVLLDDFEQNLEERESGPAGVSPLASDFLAAVLPTCREGRSSLIVTTTACFELPDELDDALLTVELGGLGGASIRKLWVRGRDEHGQLGGLRPGAWLDLADRLGRNARVLDWARQLLGGSTPQAAAALLTADETLFRPEGDERRQVELATLYLRTLAFARASDLVSSDAETFVQRAWVYDRPVPQEAFEGLTAGLDLDLARHLPALANLGLLEVSNEQGVRSWRVSPLVEPSYRASEPERWHEKASEFWEKHSQVEGGLLTERWELAWRHAVEARAESRAERLAESFKSYLHSRGFYQYGAYLAERHRRVFPDSIFALRWAGNAELHAGRAAEGLALLHRALETAEKTGVGGLALGKVLHELAIALRRQGDLAVAQHHLERCLELQRQSEEGEQSATLHALAGVLRELGDLSGARQRLERALELEPPVTPDSANPGHVLGRIETLRSLAGLLHAQGDLAGARRHLEHCVEAELAAYGTEQHPGHANTLHSLSHVLMHQDELAESRRLVEKSSEILLRCLGTDRHPEFVSSLQAQAVVLQAQGDLGAARACLERCLELGRDLFGGAPHPTMADCLHTLAVVLRDLRELSEARRCCEEALTMTTDRSLDRGDMLETLAGILERLREVSAARTTLKQALGLQEAARGTRDRANWADATVRLARLELRDGETMSALEHFEQALDVRRRLLGPDSIKTAETEWEIADLLTTIGAVDEAFPPRDHAVAVLARQVPEHRLLQAGERIRGSAEAPGCELHEFNFLLKTCLVVRTHERGWPTWLKQRLKSLAREDARLVRFLAEASQPGCRAEPPATFPPALAAELRGVFADLP